MLTTVLTLALVAVTSLVPNTGVVADPGNWGGGGPDAYGYRYLDSDTTAPGAPTYTWIEIKGVGQQVMSLGDDNVVGPFNIGFDFPYYWYTVTSFFIGSNGYIAFHDNSLDASPFQHMPSTERPNNLLAPILSDLDPSTRGTAWTWTNAANDTCIIEFDSMPFWNTGGNNSFQIILSRPDSSITFQYKEQSGQPYNGWGPDNNQTGIENVSGAVGLSYLSGTIPAQNMYHPDLAVRFYPPEVTTMEVHDAGVRNAMNDRNGGFFVANGQTVQPWAVFQNFGNQTEAPYKVYTRIKRTSGSVAHFDSAMATTNSPGDADSVVFPNIWIPSTNATYICEFYARMAGDVFPPNDTAKVECLVLSLPGILSYDRGVADAFYSWNGPGGYGARFVPPVYPCSITSIRMQAQSATGVTCKFGIFDDNGQGGSPGDTLFIGDVSVSTAQWYSLNPSSPVVIEDGAFFVGSMSSTSSDPSFGMDTLPPV